VLTLCVHSQCDKGAQQDVCHNTIERATVDALCCQDMIRRTLFVAVQCLGVTVGLSFSRLPFSVPFARFPTCLPVANTDSRVGPATGTFFDIDEEHHGEVCSIDSHHSIEYNKLEDDQERRFWQTLSIVVNLLPIVSPVAAYFTYEELAQQMNWFVELLSDNTWVAVDGGDYQAKLITPAINGVVVPAISILFATLISNTVSSLRQRLLDIRSAINMESGDLRVLATMIDSYPPGPDQDKCRSYLIQYTSRLIAESRPGVNVNDIEPTGMYTEMYGVLAQLNCMSSRMDNMPSSHCLSESYAAVTRLNNERSRRISALQSTFPSLHFIMMSALAVSICMAFLMETDQELLIFLNSIQLRLLWTMLIGTFSALGVVCYDLNDPFGGSNKVRMKKYDALQMQLLRVAHTFFISSRNLWTNSLQYEVPFALPNVLSRMTRVEAHERRYMIRQAQKDRNAF
jgi:Protein of unknown function (DUF4239)